MSRLETRVEKLEAAIAQVPTDEGFENWREFKDHISYANLGEGKVTVIGAYTVWRNEEELWAAYPAGTKFWSVLGSYEVIDGVKRMVKFPDTGEPLSPEMRECLDRVMNMAD